MKNFDQIFWAVLGAIAIWAAVTPIQISSTPPPYWICSYTTGFGRLVVQDQIESTTCHSRHFAASMYTSRFRSFFSSRSGILVSRV